MGVLAMKAGAHGLTVVSAAFAVLALSTVPLIWASSTTPQCIYFFYSDGCHSCRVVQEHLQQLEGAYPFLTIYSYEIHNQTNYEFMEDFYRYHNVTYTFPSVFIGSEILLGEEDILANIDGLLANETGRVCPSYNATVPGNTEAILPPVSIILGMAFADSMNPCAISVLLILIITISAAAGAMWKRGAAYILGNFLAYLLIGFGLFKILQQFDLPFYTSKIIGIASMVLAVLSLYLKIPDQSKPTVKKLIAAATSPPSAFLAGAVISAIELPCTGGPYFLALALMSQYNLTQAQVLGYLLVYNAIFVLPLIVILLLFAFAISPKIPKNYIRWVSAAVMFIVGAALLLI